MKNQLSIQESSELIKRGVNKKKNREIIQFDLKGNEMYVRFWDIYPAQSQNGLRTPNDTVVADAPTLAHAQKWLREKWNWHIIVEPQMWDRLTYEFKLWHKFRGYENANRGFHFSSYEVALSAGITAALELIKKGE